jgi:hypothetical protein
MTTETVLAKSQHSTIKKLKEELLKKIENQRKIIEAFDLSQKGQTQTHTVADEENSQYSELNHTLESVRDSIYM